MKIKKFNNKLNRNRNNRLKATFIYNKKVAKSFHKIAYYLSMQEDMTYYDFRQEEKKRLSVPSRLETELLIEKYKEIGKNRINKVSCILKNIYNKNYEAAVLGKEPPVNQDLHNLICNPYMFLHSYAAIKSNKGANTAAALLSLKR